MKDLIGNTLKLRDKVLVDLPSAKVFGFIADLKEPGLVAVRRGTEAAATPGHVLVSCVVSVPVDAQFNAAAQLVKVYDPDRHEEPLLGIEGRVEPSKAN